MTTLKYDKPYEDEPKPEWVLKKDKKFIGLLQEIKKDFDDGYQKLNQSEPSIVMIDKWNDGFRNYYWSTRFTISRYSF